MAGENPPPAPSVISAVHHCAECGNPFPDEEMVGYLTAFVCAGCKDRFFQKLREGAKLPGLREYAGFWIRVGAKLIDSVIIGAVMMLFMVILFAIGGATLYSVKNPDDFRFIATVVALYGTLFILIFAVQCFYHVWFVVKYGATPGKLALGLQIIVADGKPLSLKRAFARFGAEIFITGMTFNIGYLIAAFDEEKRTLHDHICNTRVVKK